jgi:hypothetical protein
MKLKNNGYFLGKIIMLNNSWGRRVFRVLAIVFFSITVLAVFVPFSPSMPSPGLDPSWILDMNQAVSQGLNFGEDIIFTYGPYASIISKMYHPATDQMMLFGSLLLASGYIIMMIYLSTEISILWIISLGILLPLIWSRDVIFFSYPFILTLIVYRITLPAKHPKKLRFSSSLFVGIPIIFFSLGLLPAIKGTLLIIVGGTMALSALMLWVNKKKVLASMAIVAPTLSFMLFWSSAGQALSALPSFFINLGQIISGYTEAMSISGDITEVFLFISVTFVILFSLIVEKPVHILSKIFLFLNYSLFLFVAFKGGFVRHDAHAITAADAIFFSALLLPFVTKKKTIILPSLVLAIFAWSSISSHYIDNSPNTLYTRTGRTYRVAWQGLQTRLLNQGFLNEKFNNSLALIRDEFTIPPLEGTTDIYSFNQAYLIASDNTWATRPVMQSYSAYTPSLAKLNENYLKSEGAPDNILFKIEPIDWRLPALEDGLSWDTIINHYSAQSYIGHYIHFQKRNSFSAEAIANEQAISIYDDIHILNNWVDLPDTKEPIFAEVIVTPTLLGKIYATLYKPPEMRMSLYSVDGKKRDFRIATTMTKSKFLISPLIESTEDFAFLTGESGYLDGRIIQRVKVYPITPSEDSSAWWLTWLWKPSYNIKLFTLYLNNDTDFTKLYLFSEIVNKSSSSFLASPSVQCEGTIDQINGVSLRNTPITLSNTLAVTGWTAINPSEGILSDNVFITLTDEQGEQLYIKTQHSPRSDLEDLFDQPEMLDSGFKVYIDISRLRGAYILGLARSSSQGIENCQNFSAQINIGSRP